MPALPSQHLTSPRLAHNNFDLLRLVFATMVGVVHVADLSGEPSLNGVSRVVSSDLAIKAFFVVSGFLIVMSCERSSNWRSYAAKRIRRIYPAYLTVVLLCAVLLSTVSSATASEYFSWPWIRYVAANLAFLNFIQPTLPGVFEGNKTALVNGALWTLKIEVAFYVVVPLLVALCRRYGWRPVLAGVYLASVAYTAVMWALTLQTASDQYVIWSRQLPGQLSYFAAGAALFYLLPAFERRVWAFVVPALVVLGIDQVYGLPMLEPAALAIVVVAAGLFGYVGNVGKYGDVSYGVYVLHFPLLQLVLHTGWLRGRPGLLFVAAALLTLAGATAMWHLVEKRFLPRTSHYRTAMVRGAHA